MVFFNHTLTTLFFEKLVKDCEKLKKTEKVKVKKCGENVRYSKTVKKRQKGD